MTSGKSNLKSVIESPGTRLLEEREGGGAEEKRLRILQLAYGTSLYGAERWVLTLAKHLDRSRFEVVIGAIRDSSTPELPLIDEAGRLGFETLVLDGRRRMVLSSTLALRKAIRSRGIDLVHSHGTRQDLIALLATRGLRSPLLSTPHGWETKGSLKVKLYDTLNRWIFPFFDAVAPLSHGLVDSLRLVPIRPSRLHLIPNGVDLGEVEAAQPLEGLLPGQAAATDFVIGYIGQLIPRKGIDVLLRALALLEPRGWCCVLIGDGAGRQAMEEEARRLGLGERVQFLGFRADRLRFLKRFGAFVLPSYLEGIPRILMEALASGVPSIGSRIPGIVELLEDGATGTTFPPGDAEALAAAIRSHMDGREAAACLARAGQALVHERYSALAMARSYESLYRRLCHGD